MILPAATPAHDVAQLNHAARVGFDFREMQCDVAAEFVEESNAVADQYRHDRIANFVGESEANTFRGQHAAADEPNRTVRRP